jgi:hypothetical protein
MRIADLSGSCHVIPGRPQVETADMILAYPDVESRGAGRRARLDG